MDKLAARAMNDTARSGLALVLLLLTFPLIFCCSFEKPSSPSWEVEIAIPLISKTYTMSEIAEDEDAITEDSTGTLTFEQTSALDEYLVGDQLDIEDQSDNFTLSLGSFTIDSPGSEFTGVELREIYSEADIFDGQTVIIPGFTFETEKKPLQAYEDFSYVVIDSGSITLHVINQLVIPLGAPITLEVWDTVADTLIVRITNNTQIQAGSAQTFSSDLSGIKLPNQLSIRMSGVSPGSSGNLVPIDASSRYDMGGEISELKAREALAKIPRQVVSRDDEITITDSLVVVEAALDSGAIALNLGGDIPLDAWLIYELPDFFDATGTSFLDSLLITRNSTINNFINLSGFSLRPQMADFAKQTVRFNWTIKTIETGDNFALVRSSDVMTADFSLTNLRFSRVTGKIGKQDIEISQKDIEFDIPADMDSIFFETAQLELVLNNGINFPARLAFDIEGQNESGSVSYLRIDKAIQPALEPGKPVTTTIVLNNENSTISEFISILPSLIKINGMVELGDPNWIGTVSTDDFVDGEVKIAAPFSLRLPAQKIDSDPNKMDIGDDVKQDIIENLSNGSFFAQISNHLPIGASVEVMFGKTDSTVYAEPILTIGPLQAEAAPTDEDGYVEQAQNSEVTFSLTEEQMRTFLQDSLYSGVRVAIDGTHGKFVKVRASDHIEIKAYTKLKVKVNQD